MPSTRETTTVTDRAGNDVLIYKDEEHKYAEWNKPKAAPEPGATKADLQKTLDDAEVEYPAKANKADLQKLADGLAPD